MTVMNVKQAEKQIRRQLSRASGVIGSEEKPFLEIFFHGRRPTAAELDYCRQALVNLEQRKCIYVTRGSSGEVVAIDEYNCEKAVARSLRPQLANYELLLVMHALLLQMSGEEGIVRSGRSMGEFVQFLTGHLELDYDISSKQVADVYAAMVSIGLRGSHQARSGTRIYPVQLHLEEEGGMANARLTHDLDQAQGKVVDQAAEIDRLRELTGTLYRQSSELNSELSRVRAALEAARRTEQELVSENERLQQSTTDLRRGKREQLEAIRAAQAALDVITKDT